MELNWELIIAILAIGISIYTLLDNKHIRKIEKKTIVLNELMEAKLIIMQLSEIFLDISKDKALGSNNGQILELKKEVEIAAEQLDYLFDNIINNKNHDKDILETSRPLIHKVKINAQNSCLVAKNFRKKIIHDKH